MTNQTTLKKLLSEIRAAEALKNTDPSSWEPRTRPGREIARNQAILSLESLNDAYRAAVGSNAVAIFVTGDGALQVEFGAIAQKLGAVVVDSKALYVAITRDAIDSLRTSGRFTPTEYAHVMSALRRLAHDDLKVVEFQRPDLIALFSKHVTDEVLVREVGDAIVKANGHAMAAIFLARLAAKEALASGYSQDVLPVIVTGANKQEIEALSASGQFTGSPSITVSLDDVKVNEEFVRDTLAQHAGDSFAAEKPAQPAVEAAESEEPESAEAEAEPKTDESSAKPPKKSKKTSKK